MKKFALFLVCLSTFSVSVSQAGIFGHSDDRVNTIHAPSYLQELAKSVVALTLKKNIKKIDNETYEVSGTSLQKFNLCSDEAFAHEASIANCSSSLIAEDLVLTAGHCLGDRPYSCGDYGILFDYTDRGEGEESLPRLFDQSQVYSCKEILYHNFDLRMAGADLAVIRLDRKVEGRKIIELDFSFDFKTAINNQSLISLIGYPLGISQKVVAEGKVTEWREKEVSFKHNLDSFSVNSGGPIFSAEGKQIGVLVRGTGSNLSFDKVSSCERWGQEVSNGFAEGNDLSLLERLLRP